MFPCCRFDIAQVALRRDPIEERSFARFITEPVRFECLPRLRHQLVAKQFYMMMRCFDFLQLIPQEAERLFLRPIERLLSGADGFTRFTHGAAVFLEIEPGTAE